MDYNYQGALVPVEVKVVKFWDKPDFVFSVESWEIEGGWKGLIRGGAFYLRDVEKVIDGKMHPVDFEKLDAWEG